jgi:cytochrome c oxidase subunit I
MSGKSLARRYWQTLSGIESAAPPYTNRRGQEGYSFWSRYVASLLNIRLPPISQRTDLLIDSARPGGFVSAVAGLRELGREDRAEEQQDNDKQSNLGRSSKRPSVSSITVRTPRAASSKASWWMLPGVHTALIGAVIGYVVGEWLGSLLGLDYRHGALAGHNDLTIILGYALMVAGWLAGIGALNDLWQHLANPRLPKEQALGPCRYFRFTLDHKVVGIQYLAGVIAYSCTAALFALATQRDLLSSSHNLSSSGTYADIVGARGTTVIMVLMALIVLGPFGNYLIPLMIGSKHVAFPRLAALSFWLTPASFLILLSPIIFSEFHIGWTGFSTPYIQRASGAYAYAFSVGLMGISMFLGALNILVTVICYRAPGMRWSRLPMFVWAMLWTSLVLLLAAPLLVGEMYMLIINWTVQVTSFANQLDGSTHLYESWSWFFGYPAVYVLALPAFGVVCELMPVFCRKELSRYRTATVGMFGVVLLGFVAWSFMLNTGLASVPTVLVFLTVAGTLWKTKIRFTVPMLFALGGYISLLIGITSGIFLRGAPTTEPGSIFVINGIILIFMGATYYWLPKMTAIGVSQTLGMIQFWPTLIFSTTTALLLLDFGTAVQQRWVLGFSIKPETFAEWISISTWLLGGSILFFVINLVWSIAIAKTHEEGNPWESRSLEWQIASPPPNYNFERIPVVAGPYEYRVPGAPPVADLNPPIEMAPENLRSIFSRTGRRGR